MGCEVMGSLFSAAIALARRFPPTVEAEDAGVWALRTSPPRAGVATVLFHSVVWSYLSEETLAAIRLAIRRAADQARGAAPIAGFEWSRKRPIRPRRWRCA